MPSRLRAEAEGMAHAGPGVGHELGVFVEPKPRLAEPEKGRHLVGNRSNEAGGGQVELESHRAEQATAESWELTLAAVGF